ncbi:MAG: hypothetical protein AB2693_24880 [Candidatus Thiodiazotropha sp.]
MGPLQTRGRLVLDLLEDSLEIETDEPRKSPLVFGNVDVVLV